MALLPALWLALRMDRRTEWWWLAGAFGVSWLADLAALFSHAPWLISTVYPVSQAAIVIAVLADREEALVYTWLLVLVGIVSVLAEGVTGPTLLLETVAAASVVSVVWPLPLGKLRICLLVAFGGGLLAWIGYVIAPGWTSWLVYQSVRAVSLLLFCWASWKPHPMLRVVA